MFFLRGRIGCLDIEGQNLTGRRRGQKWDDEEILWEISWEGGEGAEQMTILVQGVREKPRLHAPCLEIVTSDSNL